MMIEQSITSKGSTYLKVFLKWTIPGAFICYFGSFQANFTQWDLNSDYHISTLTTWPQPTWSSFWTFIFAKNRKNCARRTSKNFARSRSRPSRWRRRCKSATGRSRKCATGPVRKRARRSSRRRARPSTWPRRTGRSTSARRTARRFPSQYAGQVRDREMEYIELLSSYNTFYPFQNKHQIHWQSVNMLMFIVVKGQIFNE